MRTPTDDPRRGRSAPAERSGQDRAPRPAGPSLPDWADARQLDASVRAALRGLESRNAERVAAHLVVAGTLLSEDAAQALAHARAARDRASRVAAVREAVGVAAYQAGDYAEAARELRAYRRMSGDPGYSAVLADCERALGRPEMALRLVAEALATRADPDERAELLLVEAGARQDLGEPAAARLVLESALGGRPRPDVLDGASAGQLRLALAYADLLRQEGQEELAGRWEAAVTAADPDLVGRGEPADVLFWEEEIEATAGFAAQVGAEVGAEVGAPSESAPPGIGRSVARASDGSPPETARPGGAEGPEADILAEAAEPLGEKDTALPPPAGTGDDGT